MSELHSDPEIPDLAETHSKSWEHWTLFMPWVVLGLALFITFQLWQAAQLEAERNLRNSFQARVDDSIRRIQQRMLDYEQVLAGVRGLFAASSTVERGEFRAFVESLNIEKSFPGVQSVGWVAMVTAAQKKAHIDAIRREGFPNYTIKPPGERDIYAVVVYVEPFLGRNMRAFGQDHYADPVRRHTINQARDLNAAFISGKVKLAQETDQRVQAGFQMALPVYRCGIPPRTVALRRSEFIGLVGSSFRMGDLMRGILGAHSKNSDIDIEIYDGDHISEPALMHDADGVLQANNVSQSRFHTVKQLKIVNHTWTLAAHSLPAFEAKLDRTKLNFIAASGLGTGGLLAILTAVLMRGRARALKAALTQRANDALRLYRTEMQQQVKVATAELAAQKTAAEMANAAKSHFLAAASHDLRQPMHAIGLYVEALKPLLSGHQAARTLDKLAASVTALEGLFNAILDVSKLDAGAVQPQWQAIALRDFLHNLVISLQMDAAHQGLDLRVRACDVYVYGDPQLLERILRNLISNALRYTERGGVLVSTRGRGDKVLIQVHDTGEGINPADLPRIFDEFYQAHNPARDRSQGLGLGLSIVRRLAQLLDYPLRVRSVPGKGTVFDLTVPVCEKPAISAATQHQRPAYTSMHGCVAIVDDDVQVLDGLKTLLTGWGLEVIAADSSDALCAQLTHAPDVLLTDWRLAHGETGQHVVNKLVAKFPGARIQVLVITGDISMDGEEISGLSQLPALHKPVKPARLRALLREMLGQQY